MHGVSAEHDARAPTSDEMGDFIRAMRALQDLTHGAGKAHSIEDCLVRAASSLEHGDFGLPFLLAYALDDECTKGRLVAHSGLSAGQPASPATLEVTTGSGWPVAEALSAGRAHAVEDVQARFPGLVCGARSEPVRCAYVLPINPSVPRATAVVIAGATQRLPRSVASTAFYELLAAGLTNAVVGAMAVETERLRAEALRWSKEADGASDGHDLDIGDSDDARHLAPGVRARVLLAEGNPEMRSYLATLLRRVHDVRAVADGDAAFDAATAAPPDLIVVDLQLPGRDGLALLKELRAAETTCLIPVILLSARVGEDAALEGLDAGADDYLVKPFSGKALLARVRSCLALAKMRKDLTDKLTDANKELEAFSYSVSHDLRAPLRAIDGFSDALLTEYGAHFDDQGRYYVERVRAGTQRMAQLIDDLLSLSRITRASLSHDRVDLTAIGAKVLSELGLRDPARKVEVRIADGLAGRGDSRLVKVLFENLLGNAWKFTSKVPEARIDVGSESRGGETVFFVRDNGAGFDMAYASKLFEPFQRLHTPAEFEGTGIGLATVHRVVKRHGGRIWAQAEPNRGATFFFTLGERP